MTASQRIKHILNFKKTSITDFCERHGLVRGTLNQMWRLNRDPSFELLTICLKEFPDLNAHWLLTGEGEVWLEDKKSTPNYDKLDHRLKDVEKQIEQVFTILQEQKNRSNE